MNKSTTVLFLTQFSAREFNWGLFTLFIKFLSFLFSLSSILFAPKPFVQLLHVKRRTLPPFSLRESAPAAIAAVETEELLLIFEFELLSGLFLSVINTFIFSINLSIAVLWVLIFKYNFLIGIGQKGSFISLTIKAFEIKINIKIKNFIKNLLL